MRENRNVRRQLLRDKAEKSALALDTGMKPGERLSVIAIASLGAFDDIDMQQAAADAEWLDESEHRTREFIRDEWMDHMDREDERRREEMEEVENQEEFYDPTLDFPIDPFLYFY